MGLQIRKCPCCSSFTTWASGGIWGCGDCTFVSHIENEEDVLLSDDGEIDIEIEEPDDTVGFDDED